jgi:hypothetical protein
MPEYSSGRWSKGQEPAGNWSGSSQWVGKRQRKEGDCHDTCLALSEAPLCCSLAAAQREAGPW